MRNFAIMIDNNDDKAKMANVAGNDILCIIPARWGSTRFPGKPLARLGRSTVIEHVIAAALKATPHVVVATDHAEIARVAFGAGARAVMTSPECANGTARCAEAVRSVDTKRYSVVVNLQGDEPLITPDQILDVARAVTDCGDIIATLFRRVDASAAEVSDPSAVKVVMRSDGCALYFSRAPIPYGSPTYDIHVGIYAMRPAMLAAVATLYPSGTAEAERLEQLTWLDAGLTIRCIPTTRATVGIDTPDDLIKARSMI